jgi:recombination protein RecA
MAKKIKLEDKDITTVSGGLDSILNAVKKDIGKDFEITKDVGARELKFLSTGNPAVNYAFSGKVDGGFPVGWISELAGLNATGKSLLAQNALIETQKLGGVSMLVDSEYAFNPDWFRKNGGDPDQLIHFNPDHIEDAYQFMDNTICAIRKQDKTIPITIVYDSVAASPSKMEFEGNMEKHDMGKRAIAHGKGIRLMMGLTSKQNVTFIAINQFRKTMAMFGPDMDTTGGMAWDYACSLRVKMKKGAKITKKVEGITDPVIIGIAGTLEVTKNRIRSPFAKAEFNIYYDSGIDPTSGLLDVLIREGDVKAAGQGWWQYRDDKFQKGKFNEILDKYPELLNSHERIEVPEDAIIPTENDEESEEDSDDAMM